MPDPPESQPPSEWERQQAHDYVMQRLAPISAVIWAVGMIAFMVFVFPGRPFKPSIGMVIGAWLLALAAVPWIAYPRLVERRVLAARQQDQATHPDAG